MSEEITYADLKFQDSSEKENIYEFDGVGIKGKILNFGYVAGWASHFYQKKKKKLKVLVVH